MLLGIVAHTASLAADTGAIEWTDEQRAIIDKLRLANLPQLPESPGNPVADDEKAARLGQRFFFDENLSATGEISCATCHQPSLNFTDGLPRSRAIGETARKSMTLVGTAWSPWFYWDGRRDSLWAQALVPMEDSVEHGGTRTMYAHRIKNDADLLHDYEAVFSPIPDLSDFSRFPLSAGPFGTPSEIEAWQTMSEPDQKLVNHIFANIGRAIEAYERRLKPGITNFDRFADALLDNDVVSAPITSDDNAGDSAETISANNNTRANKNVSAEGNADAFLTAEQQRGLQLFIGKAQCIHCHNGPLFTNNEFHNTGLFPENELPTDRGRIEGVLKLLDDPFNCLGEEAAANEASCAELRFVKTQGIELVAAFRTPTLRNIAKMSPYMHTGQFADLASVLDHYNVARPTLISDELDPLDLEAEELEQLESFLHALSAPLDVPDYWLNPP